MVEAGKLYPAEQKQSIRKESAVILDMLNTIELIDIYRER